MQTEYNTLRNKYDTVYDKKASTEQLSCKACHQRLGSNEAMLQWIAEENVALFEELAKEKVKYKQLKELAEQHADQSEARRVQARQVEVINRMMRNETMNNRARIEELETRIIDMKSEIFKIIEQCDSIKTRADLYDVIEGVTDDILNTDEIMDEDTYEEWDELDRIRTEHRWV